MEVVDGGSAVNSVSSALAIAIGSGLTVKGADEFAAPLAIWSAVVDAALADTGSPVAAPDVGAFEVAGVTVESGIAGDPAPSVLVDSEH